MSVVPGPIRQIGYIVTDIDRAIASWLDLGVGPWFMMRDLPLRCLYRGAPCEITMTLALANSGELQIELIQQEGDTPSIYTEFLNSSGPGYHQLAYWAEDFDAVMALAREAGWPVVWSGGEDVGARFAYLEPPDGPATIIEVMELTETTLGMAHFVRDAAVDWDGSDPIRILGG